MSGLEQMCDVILSSCACSNVERKKVRQTAYELGALRTMVMCILYTYSNVERKKVRQTAYELRALRSIF